MNWRILVGMLFFVMAARVMYMIIVQPTAIKLSVAPIYAEFGCTIWIGVGIFLIVRGIKQREN